MKMVDKFSHIDSLHIRQLVISKRGRYRINVTMVERYIFYMLLISLMIPLVLRREIHIYFFDPFLATIYILWFFRITHSRKSSKSRRFLFGKLTLIDLLVASLVFWSLFSTIFAIDANEGLIFWLLFMRGVLLFVYIRFNVVRIIQPPELLRIFVLFLLLEGVVALIQFITNSRIGSINDIFGDVKSYPNAYFYSSFGRIIRVVGTFNNPNLLADWLILFLPAVFAELYLKTVRYKVVYYFLLILSLSALVFTFSRSSWVSLFIGVSIAVLRIIALNKSKLIRISINIFKYGVILTTAFGIAMVVNNYLSRYPVMDMVRDRFSNVNGGGEWRMAYVNVAIQLIQQFPITGVGLGNFNNAMVTYRQFLSIPDVLSTSESFSTVHNVYLLFAVDTGIIGGILWMLLSIVVLIQSWQLYAKSIIVNTQYIAFSLWLLIAWMGFVVNSNFEAVFFHPSILMVVFMLMGLIVSLSEYSNYIKRQYLSRP